MVQLGALGTYGNKNGSLASVSAAVRPVVPQLLGGQNLFPRVFTTCHWSGPQPWGLAAGPPVSAEAERGGTSHRRHSCDASPDLPSWTLRSHSLSWVFVGAAGLERLVRGLCCLW